jgi:hypothetical protein
MTEDRCVKLERLWKLLRSYNPRLPMGAGMAVQFAAIMADCEPAPPHAVAVPGQESAPHALTTRAGGAP